LGGQILTGGYEPQFGLNGWWGVQDRSTE